MVQARNPIGVFANCHSAQLPTAAALYVTRLPSVSQSPLHACVSVHAPQIFNALSVFRLDEIRHGLWLLVHVLIVAVAVIVSMAVILWSNVLHLVHTAALWAALDRALAGSGEPDDNVRVDGVTGAAEVLLVAEGLDSDGILECSYSAVRRRAVSAEVLCLLPLREASNGFMSKTSTPCIFPRISRRSRPVACSRSVGMVPGLAPGGRRSCSLLMSVYLYQPELSSTDLVSASCHPSCALTVERFEQVRRLAGLWVAIGSCLLCQPCYFSLRGAFRGAIGIVLRRAESANERVTVGRKMARLASAGAARRRNMLAVLVFCGSGVVEAVLWQLDVEVRDCQIRRIPDGSSRC